MPGNVNVMGSGRATIALARWDNAVDLEKVRQVVPEQGGKHRPGSPERAHLGESLALSVGFLASRWLNRLYLVNKGSIIYGIFAFERRSEVSGGHN
jgi:hypothetical protein